MKRKKQLYTIETIRDEFFTDAQTWGKKEQAALYTYEEASEMVSKIEAETDVFCESLPVEEEVKQFSFTIHPFTFSKEEHVIHVSAISEQHAVARLGAVLIQLNVLSPIKTV